MHPKVIVWTITTLWKSVEKLKPDTSGTQVNKWRQRRHTMTDWWSQVKAKASKTIYFGGRWKYTLQRHIFKPVQYSHHVQFPMLIKWAAAWGHRPVIIIVKRALICSKGGWKLSTIFLSCKVFHDWSIIKLWKYIVFIRWVYLRTTSHCFCWLSLLVCLR